MILNPVVIYTMLGIVLVTFIDAVGAFLSRKLQFNYAWMGIASFVAYTYVGFLVSQASSLLYVIITSAVIALYDSTVGWNLCLYFKASISLSEEEMESFTLGKRLLSSGSFALVFGIIGHLFA